MAQVMVEPTIPTPEWSDMGRLTCLMKNSIREIGYLNWRLMGDELYIAGFLIYDKSHRQQGIGSKMIVELLKMANANGVARITGLTRWDDYSVHDFYRKHGFVFDEKPVDGCIYFHLQLCQ